MSFFVVISKAENQFLFMLLIIISFTLELTHNPSQFKYEGITLILQFMHFFQYSKPLQQVFINVNKIMVMKFSVDSYQHGLFIRALPVFSSCSYSQYPVDRCPAHSKKDDPEFKG